ncbi:MAG: TolC family protein [Deltaproteobacteria bacterium]|nr:TolC family protein [Deltaproteobacteria bacterium]
MRKKLLHFILIFVLAVTMTSISGSVSIAADSPKTTAKISKNTSENTITVQALIEEALSSNPRIKANQLLWESTAELETQARAYDEPLISYTKPMREIETRLGPQEHIFKLSQKIPFPGKLGKKSLIAKKEAEIAEEKYEQSKTNLRAIIKKTFFELHYLQEAIIITKEKNAVLDYFKKISQSNYNLGLSGLDILIRAQKQSAETALKLINLEQKKTTLRGRLEVLLNKKSPLSGKTLKVPDVVALQITEDEAIRLALLNQNEIKIANLGIEKTRLKRDLTSYNYLPDFQIGVTYSSIGEPVMTIEDGGQDALALTFGVKIPLWFGKYRAKGAESRLLQERAQVIKDALVTETENNVETLISEINNFLRIFSLYDTQIIPEARSAVLFAEARYKSGEEKLAKLLETQSMWLNFRLTLARTKANYLKSTAELERLLNRALF